MTNYLLIILLASTGSFAPAQQPKAYENVRYAAQAKGMSFQLNYDDGYLGASKIRLYQMGKTTKTFLPYSGVPEANGNFLFHSENTKSELILTHINQERTAPKAITATYKINNRPIKLIFYRKP